MANCKAETGIKHFIIDVRNEEEVIESLMGVMESDCDLTENEEYFRRNTLKLGYDSEADRIVKEYIKKKGVPNTIKAFKKAYEKMSDRISEQEFLVNVKLVSLILTRTEFQLYLFQADKEVFKKQSP